MKLDNRQIRDYINIVSMFVKENDTIIDALLLMQKLNVTNLVVVDENLCIKGNISKETISFYLNENNFSTQSKQTKVFNLNDKEKTPVVLYPGTSIYQADSIMKCLKIKRLPVADKPWSKKIIGYISHEDILSKAF